MTSKDHQLLGKLVTTKIVQTFCYKRVTNLKQVTRLLANTWTRQLDNFDDQLLHNLVDGGRRARGGKLTISSQLKRIRTWIWSRKNKPGWTLTASRVWSAESFNHILVPAYLLMVHKILETYFKDTSQEEQRVVVVRKELLHEPNCAYLRNNTSF